MLVSNWLEHYQVIVGALINISAVVTISFITNQLQFRRENQRWQREKIYNLYEDARKCFSESLKTLLPLNYLDQASTVSIRSTIASLSKLTSVSYDQTLEDIESIKAVLMKILDEADSDVRINFRNLLLDVSLLSEKLEEVIKTDSRLKDLFK